MGNCVNSIYRGALITIPPACRHIIHCVVRFQFTENSLLTTTTVVQGDSPGRTGNCSFTHTGPGASPPSFTVWLEQTLYRLGNYGQIMSGQPAGAARPAGIWTAIHSRTGLNPPKLAWNDSKAQVYGKCPKPSDPAYNGANYKHFDLVWIIASLGWRYIGPNPLSVGVESWKYFKCWK